MSNDFCPCLSGGQCRLPEEEFTRKLETKEIEVAHQISLTTGPVLFLDLLSPRRFGAVTRHNRKVKVALKLAKQKGFDHVRSGDIFQSGAGLQELVIQGFTFFREQVLDRFLRV